MYLCLWMKRECDFMCLVYNSFRKNEGYHKYGWFGRIVVYLDYSGKDGCKGEVVCVK